MMSWRSTIVSLLLLLWTVDGNADNETKRVLLLAGKGSHGYGAHEHEAGIRVLAKCLQGVPNLDVSTHYVGDGWPEGPELIEKADGIVMFLDFGSRFEQEDPQRKAALEDLMARGGGVVALHWAVGGPEAEYIPFHLRLVGGCHGGPDRKYTQVLLPAQVGQAGQGHPAVDRHHQRLSPPGGGLGVRAARRRPVLRFRLPARAQELGVDRMPPAGRPGRALEREAARTRGRAAGESQPGNPAIAAAEVMPDTRWFRDKVFVHSYPVALLRHVFRRPCSGLR